jgi:hypothetical protein
VDLKRRRVVVGTDELQSGLRLRGGHRHKGTLQPFQMRCWRGKFEFKLGCDETSPLVTERNPSAPATSHAYDHRAELRDTARRPRYDIGDLNTSLFVIIEESGYLDSTSIAKINARFR